MVGGVFMMNLENTQTKENLMRAYAGESQAHVRYILAANKAKADGFPIIEKTFKFIAQQEIAHANIYYEFLESFKGDHISLGVAAYPVDICYNTTPDFLKAAHEREMDEHDNIYSEFGKVAAEEGFPQIADKFNQIACIEKIHADKFMKIYTELTNGTLFKKPTKIKWFCTNCGKVHEAEEAPQVCPVCLHPRGYFVPFTEAFQN